MEIVKNPIVRRIFRLISSLEMKLKGQAFPGMKRLRQITLSHCGPAVLSSLFSFVGVSVPQRKVTYSTRTSQRIHTYGLSTTELARAAKIFGQKGKFLFWIKKEATIQDLNKIVNKYKFPVGIEWQGVFYENEDGDNGHYSIVTEINITKGYVKLADPFHRFAGVDRVFKLKDFTDRWWDTNMVGSTEVFDRRVMFVVVPKGIVFPRKIGMIKK